jgi:MgtC family
MVPYNSERPAIIRSRDVAPRQKKFFTKFTMRKAIFYCLVTVYWIIFAILCFAELFLPDSVICSEASIPSNELAKAKINYKNPSFTYNPCEQMHLPYLLYLSRLQCNFGRRLLASGFLGGIVGWERREADRPAGIRTMALVSLGVCLFSIDSMYSFWDGPMGWDSSRVAAAIPSGVGFLGAGVIFKDAHKNDDSGASTFLCNNSPSLYAS